MTRQSFRKQLHALCGAHTPIAPDPAWVARTRSTLLGQIRNTVGVSRSAMSAARLFRVLEYVRDIFLPKRLLAMGRTTGIFALVGLVTASGWIATVSAAESLPGDALYQVKLAREKTELLVASVVGGETDRVTTLLKHASHRVEEYQKSRTAEQATRAIKSLKSSIATAHKELNDAEDRPGAVAVARVVTEKTDELLTSLGHGSVQSGDAASRVVSATTSSSSSPSQNASVAGPATPEQALLQKEVGEASHLITVTAVKAVEVLVEKKLEGSQQLNLEEVKASMEKKVEQLVADVSIITKDVAAAGTFIASSTVALPAGAATGTQHAPGVVVVPPVAAGTPVSTTTAGALHEAFRVTEQKMGEATKAAEKTAAEAKTLIENNDLLAAMKKVETLVTVKKDAASAVIDAKIATETIVRAGESAQAVSSSSLQQIVPQAAVPAQGVQIPTTLQDAVRR